MDLNLLGLGALVVSLALLVPLNMPSALRWLSREVRSLLESHAAALEAYAKVWELCRKQFRQLDEEDKRLSADYAALTQQRRQAAGAAAQRMKGASTIQ
jgi:hypothetical protein